MKRLGYLFFCAALLLSLPVQSQEEESGEGVDEVRYIELTPAIVTNYGGPGKLKYIKAEVSLRVSTQEAYRSVVRHMPLLRHTVVMLLGEQTDETIADSAAKDELRQAALAQVKAAMQKEAGGPMVEDLLFSTFFVQQ